MASLSNQVFSAFMESSSLTLILLLIFTVFLVYYLYDMAYSVNSHPALPRPWRFPIVGNLPQFGKFPHKTLTKFGKTFGDVFAIRLGSWDVLVVNSLSAAKEVLFQKSAYFSSRPPFFSLRLCDSQKHTVAFGDYDSSQIQRKKALLQAFHRVILTNPEYLNRMVSEEAARLNNILLNTGGSPFDPRACLKMTVSRLVYRLSFGGVVGPVEEHDLFQLFKVSREFQESTGLVLLADFMPWMKFAVKRQMSGLEDTVRVLQGFVRQAYRRRKYQNVFDTQDYCIAKALENHVKSVKRQAKRSEEDSTKAIVKDCKADSGSELEQKECRLLQEKGIKGDGAVKENDNFGICDESDWKANTETHSDLKESKRESKETEREGIEEGNDGIKENEFTQDEEDQIETSVVQMLSSDAFGAGLENTSGVFCWSIAYIASNKELQKDLHAEIDQVIGDREPCVAHKQNMPLMQATIMETLRLSCVIPMGLPHYCIKDSVVKGYHVPKETVVLTNIWGINHDDRNFSHPECFEPYRFLDLNGNLRGDRYSLVMTFNMGPRTCPGNAVTKTMLFLLLSNLLQKFEFQSMKNLVNLSPLPGPLLTPEFFEVVFRPRQ